MSLKPMPIAYIISLKFSPGLKKEFCLIGENIRKQGFEVKYLLSSEYEAMGGRLPDTVYIPTRNTWLEIIQDSFDIRIKSQLRRILSDNPPRLVFFYNSHPLNLIVAKYSKSLSSNAVCALFLHEPYIPDKILYGIKRATVMVLTEIMLQSTLKYIDHIILPSEHSHDLYNLRWRTINQTVRVIPLPIPDHRNSAQQPRLYFSMVGMMNATTGHNVFFDLVQAYEKNHYDTRFCIASSSDMSAYLNKDEYRSHNNLEICIKQKLSDKDIDDVISQSLAVFRLNLISAQSGVIPLCYMHGTPIIATDIPGLSQHVIHKSTGYIVPCNPSISDLMLAIDYINSHFSELSNNAISYYEDIWAEQNWNRYYSWVQDIL